MLTAERGGRYPGISISLTGRSSISSGLSISLSVVVSIAIRPVSITVGIRPVSITVGIRPAVVSVPGISIRSGSISSWSSSRLSLSLPIVSMGGIGISVVSIGIRPGVAVVSVPGISLSPGRGFVLRCTCSPVPGIITITRPGVD